MNKIFFTVIAFFALMQVSFAQDRVFAKGDKVVGLSTGFLSSAYSGNGWKMTAPPILLTGEYGIVDGLINGNASIGAGVDFGYVSRKYNAPLLSYKYSNLIFGARGSFHYQFVDKLDTYAGFMLGYDIVSGNDHYASSGFAWGSYVGARYYFFDNFAAMAEIGNNISLINVGVAFKF
ncbi:MAG: hypothetical protein LBQ70_02370 [Prevotellaceae bacterium]|nr:hypothetical protein [Prevotellaceae bacterium]